MTIARPARAPAGRPQPVRLDWRAIAVAVVMTAAFAGALAFPETFPYALIWAAVIAAAAFVSPRTAALLGVFGIALSVIGGIISGNADSQIFWFRIAAYALIGVIAVLLSAQRSRREAALLDRATTDDLTGVATRHLLVERLEAQMEVRDRDGVPAVFYTDLDFFKKVNDTHGHGAGDEVLRRASERLLACTRTADTLARFGGDEFVIACPTVDGEDGVRRVCDRIIEAFGPPFHVAGVEMSVGITVGAAFAEPGTQTSPGALIDAADEALIACKQSERGTYTIVKV